MYKECILLFNLKQTPFLVQTKSASMIIIFSEGQVQLLRIRVHVKNLCLMRQTADFTVRTVEISCTFLKLQ